MRSRPLALRIPKRVGAQPQRAGVAAAPALAMRAAGAARGGLPCATGPSNKLSSVALARRATGAAYAQRGAAPPPTTPQDLAVQRMYAQHRPLLEHELLPARPARLVRPDMIFTDAQPEPAGAGAWRRKARGVDPATFNGMVDRLSQLQVAPRQRRRRSSAGSRSRFSPASPAVAAESQRMERQERDEDAREEAIANALERGEDVARAERLGAEAELVVLGEPNGTHREWGRGVATHLGTCTQPYVPPAAPKPNAGASSSAEDATAPDAALNAEFAGEDEDVHLWLSHGLVQQRVGASRAWEQFVREKLDPVAPPEQGVKDPAPATQVHMDSVRRKRRKKMNKHKHKKLRKAQRAERQRLKK